MYNALKLKTVLISLAAVFAPAGPMLATAALLIFIDLVTGIACARKRHESITSAGIGRSVAKLVVYELAIGLAFLCQTYLTGDILPLAHIVASLVGVTELLSCYENINELSGQNMLKTIIDKISSQNK